MGNPIMGIIDQMIRGSVNPQAILKEIMGNNQIMSNSIMKNALQMYQKGDIKSVKEIANNLAKERGTTVEKVKNDIMQRYVRR